MIKLEGLCKTYGENNVLKNIDLEINKGEFLMITGTSGCGKTSLMNILGLMDTKTSGKYYFNGEDIDTIDEVQKSKIRNTLFGFVFQSFNLINDFTVIENIEMPMGIYGINKSERKERVDTLLKKFDISDKGQSLTSQLSGGQKQRVAIARAISNNPSVIFADEPTGNLDENNTQTVLNIFRKLNQDGITIVMITHDRELLKYADRVVELDYGKIKEVYNFV
ncbi:ABC transporter ATP-binding protein [Peptostreptococcus porci]|uniref:ABC transporter ATP-binding protein n=1 Tax=Peptostreptococcus porci TaxID=2652282 RepID=A0A6N7X1C3_9FIRM|nr:ABC transporter ATP-binding protein [Peptostreptococcus porci]MDD7182119.1 ABC transporter ATP-binding protein [Peptostreptococcus porci]MDY2793646.1 ABC transporter ATP-binding protein [Peptostreptococcus porci]MDY5436272.1 ABC transporter ATP-binding protein [Peptostreptococcus porci]MDY6231583.1 ABC transporter ATP-binding protein [Peptostreptococcus porci]MST62945.1 ABC transporter ATP-binding protein [Peptostreptococcus porci]